MPEQDDQEKPKRLAEGNPTISSIVQGADAFELLGQIPELKAHLKGVERAIDRQQDETLRSFDRIDAALKSMGDRHEKATEASEARLVKAIDYQRDAIKELGDKINGINWKLALAAGAVMVGSALLTSLLPLIWKAIIH